MKRNLLHIFFGSLLAAAPFLPATAQTAQPDAAMEQRGTRAESTESNYYEADGVRYRYKISGDTTCFIYEAVLTDETKTSIAFPDRIKGSDGKNYTVTSFNPEGSDVSIISEEYREQITDVKLPLYLTGLSDYTFSNCSALREVMIPYGVTSIGVCAFNGCSNLSKVEIPTTVTSIGREAFASCNKLMELIIPSSVRSLGQYITGDESTNPEQKIFLLTPSYAAVSINSRAFDFFNGTLYCDKDLYFPKLGENRVDLFNVENSSLLTRLKFTAEPSDPIMQIKGISLDGVSATLKDGVYTIDNLNQSFSYNLAVDVSINGKSYQTGFALSTKSGSVKVLDCSTTQSTATINFEAASDESCKPTAYRIKDIVFDKPSCVIKGLSPDTKYYFSLDVQYNGRWIRYSTDYSYFTKSMNPTITETNLTSGSFSCVGSYEKGDAKVTKVSFSDIKEGGNDISDRGSTIVSGNSLRLIDLTPNTEYSVTYTVEVTGNSVKNYPVTYTFRTPELELTTVAQAKAVSNDVALICATTNLGDDVTGAGFEWRRYDAPDLVPSTQSPCPVIDGMLTGALRNLSSDTYYKFRPYYTAASGETYYGEWSAFGTADAYVYFDPTVRTYAVEVSEADGVTLRGYAVAGSDEITEQGFEYWPQNGTSAQPMRVLAADEADGKQSVVATGQWMTATLSDLTPATTYAFRAYVTTAKGTTYGDTRTFETPVPTGIADATASQADGLTLRVRQSAAATVEMCLAGSAAETCAYSLYNLTGAAVAQGRAAANGNWTTVSDRPLPRGIYVLTVSDGTHRRSQKVMVK